MDERTIKAAVKSLREELGATQDVFAEALGMDTSTYWRFEEGNTRILNPNIYKIARHTGRDVEEILLGRARIAELRDEGRGQEQIEALKAHYEAIIDHLNDYIRMLKAQAAEK